MACFRPLVGQVRANGRVGFHDQPGDVGAIRLGCGHCIGCKLDRASAWAIRCQHEASRWEDNSFVTLTYDDDHVPCVARDGRHIDRWSDIGLDGVAPESTGLSTLHYPDVQRFLKRLRKSSASRVRFFCAGEYGESTGRPHYHILLFNRGFRDRLPIGKSLWESESLSALWPFGLSSIGDVTPASAAYVSKYALKKVYGRVEAAEHYQGRRPEFVTMSRRPGIGADWYDNFRGDVLPNDFVVVSGRKYKVPRYYQEKFKESHPEDFGDVVEARERDSLQRGGDSRSFDRLAVAEEVTAARLNLLSERKL